jgi:hypothetical protein
VPSSLPALLNENPFTVLGVSVDASQREIRRRLEDLELEAAWGRESAFGRTATTRAAQMLEDPRQRIKCELLTRWTGTTTYGAVARVHDAALIESITVLDRRRRTASHVGIDSIRSWIELGHDPRVAAMIEKRFVELGLGSADAWLIATIGDSIVPTIVSRTLEIARGEDSHEDMLGRRVPGTIKQLRSCSAIAAILPRLGLHAVQAIGIVTDEIQHTLGTDGSLERLSIDDLVQVISLVHQAARSCQKTTPQSARPVVAALVTAVDGQARRRFRDGDKEGTEKLLAGLLDLDLTEGDRLQVSDDLRSVRFSIAWAKGLEHIEYGEWLAAKEAFAQAEAIAPDAELARQAREYAWRAVMASRRGVRGARTRVSTPPSEMPQPAPSASIESRTAPAASQPAPGRPSTNAVAAYEETGWGARTGRALGRFVARHLKIRRPSLSVGVTYAVSLVALGLVLVFYMVRGLQSKQADSPPASAARTNVSSGPPARPRQSSNSSPVSRPEWLMAYQYVVNSMPVGCHESPGAEATITVQHAPGAIQTVDQVIRTRGEVWHRDKDRHCWIRTDPGPVRMFTMLSGAKDYAATIAPQILDKPTFVVNTAPVGCHQSPDATALIVAQRPLGSVQEMDAFMRAADGVWHRVAGQGCWVRTQPGPIMEFQTSAVADVQAASLRRAAFVKDVGQPLNDLRAAVRTADNMDVQIYEQASGNAAFADAADRAIDAARRLGQSAANTEFGTDFPNCRDALIARSHAEEQFWSELSAAARFSNPFRWNNAVLQQDAIGKAIRQVNDQCKGILS